MRIRNKDDLSDFEQGMFVSARRAGLNISETADLLGFSKYPVHSSSVEKCLQGPRGMTRLIQANRKAAVTQINRGVQKSISESTTHQTLKQIGYSSRSRKLRL